LLLGGERRVRHQADTVNLCPCAPPENPAAPLRRAGRIAKDKARFDVGEPDIVGPAASVGFDVMAAPAAIDPHPERRKRAFLRM